MVRATQGQSWGNAFARNGFSLGQGGVHSKFWEKSAVGERFESSAAQPTPDQVRLCFPARCRVPANIWRPLKVAMDEAAPPLPPPAFPPPALCARRHVQQWHRSRCAPAPNARLPDVMVVSEGCAIRYMLSSAWPHFMCVYGRVPFSFLDRARWGGTRPLTGCGGVLRTHLT